MKLLITGDWHLRTRSPVSRLGDFYGDQMKKLGFVLEIAVEHECEAILHPGDLGDSPNWSNYLKSQVILLLRHYGIPILCVSGQHDQKYHSLQSMDRTSLRVLEAAEVVQILDSSCFNFGLDSSVSFYGTSYGQDIPKVMVERDFNILVIHRMILKDSKRLWPTQRDYAVASVFLRQHSEFDLIVSGDNHQGFNAVSDMRMLVNCGALMRAEASKEMIQHKPFVVVYDTDSKSAKPIDIPIKPAEEVLDRERIEQVQQRNEKLEAFVEGLTSDYSVSLDFGDNLEQFLKENKVRMGVKDIFKEVLDGTDSTEAG